MGMGIRTQGFSTIEIILVVVTIGIIGTVGYLFVQSSQKQQDTQTPETTGATPTTKSSSDEPKAALENVQAFYKKFLLEPDHSDAYPPASWIRDNYVTQAAADQYTNASAVDPVTCSQNPLAYEKYTFSTPSINGATGTVHVTGKYESGDTTMIMLNLTKDDGHWKISKFSCSM